MLTQRLTAPGVLLLAATIFLGCATRTEWPGTSDFGAQSVRTLADNVECAMDRLRGEMIVPGAREAEVRRLFLSEAEQIVDARQSGGLGDGALQRQGTHVPPTRASEALRAEIASIREKTDAAIAGLLEGDDRTRYALIAPQIHRDLARRLSDPVQRQGSGWSIGVSRWVTFP